MYSGRDHYKMMMAQQWHAWARASILHGLFGRDVRFSPVASPVLPVSRDSGLA